LKELPEVILFDPAHREVIAQSETDGPDFIVRRENEVYVVEGPAINRLLGKVNFDDRESLQYFQRAIKNMGVIDALVAKGVEDGDTVRVGDVEFDYVP
jgi:GTP-binding protein